MTNKVYDNIDDLLVKVLLGEASQSELFEVEHWVALDPANEKYLADFRHIWEESRKLAVQSTVNEDDAWNDFRRRVGSGARQEGRVRGMEDGEEGHHAVNRRAVVKSLASGSRKWWRIAAVLLLLLGGGKLYYKYSYLPGQFTVVYSGEHVVTDTLPEGTVVTLNKQSSIRYRKLLAGTVRAVELRGEAFFNVRMDKNRPFLVDVNGVLIRVIGTSFNVRTAVTADTAKSATEVIVETGGVEITSDAHTIRLAPHEKAVVQGNNQPPVKEENEDDLYNYYRTHEFVCNGLPLERLVEKLNEVYKLHVVIGNSRLRNLPLTATFREESPDEILYVITRTLKITLVRNGEEIILQ